MWQIWRSDDKFDRAISAVLFFVAALVMLVNALVIWWPV